MAGGRPPKLKPEDRETIYRMIEEGRPKRFAAQAVGITERTLYNYLRRGADDLAQGKKTTVYAEFFQSVKRAEAIAVGDLLDKIDRAAWDVHGKWQAFAWKLERMFPSEFGSVSTRAVREDEFSAAETPLDQLVESLRDLREGRAVEETEEPSAA